MATNISPIVDEARRKGSVIFDIDDHNPDQKSLVERLSNVSDDGDFFLSRIRSLGPGVNRYIFASKSNCHVMPRSLFQSCFEDSEYYQKQLKDRETAQEMEASSLRTGRGNW